MQRPFEVLGEYLGLSIPRKNLELDDPLALEKPFLSEEKEWSEVVKKVKPLKEKNFFYFFSHKKPFWEVKKEWPPKRIDLKVWLTSEYIEGVSSKVYKSLLYDLREGRFAIKRTLNLRGMFVEEAKIAFEDFLKEAILNGDNCVLIIHGRGLSSKKEPVLKTKVKEWLEKGPFRKYVIAFCSARPCDGGLGATYVLLSSKPIKKSTKKSRNNRCF
ncbi:Smr/MutS family protein [Thermodesulfobacterium sp. TA1]|uniref:Smr/MutS family protein n=1 Tax=Thermodesulfobacterium sp. TA1 TaxID=2234087 RepID=UPI0012324B05|nr:Smr/MutS family protein [Thermodesulfobacterium sp. TA1]QER42493.1 Smr/MutS family protein [Thermodesulfobacterium sp. TA1]